jgi:hypothetical protein
MSSISRASMAAASSGGKPKSSNTLPQLAVIFLVIAFSNLFLLLATGQSHSIFASFLREAGEGVKPAPRLIVLLIFLMRWLCGQRHIASIT